MRGQEAAQLVDLVGQERAQGSHPVRRVSTAVTLIIMLRARSTRPLTCVRPSRDISGSGVSVG